MQNIVSYIGLGLIIAGWLVQLARSWKGDKRIQPAFIGIYAVGVLALAFDGFASGLTELALLNTASLIAAALVLARTLK